MSTQNLLTNAEEFLWKNARLLERQSFRYHFQQGTREAVLTALKAYQNPDGGFGNGLEPDKTTPYSQPIDQEFGLHVLHEIGNEESLTEGVCRFLESITTVEGGVPFTLPSVTPYPHAFWWNTDENPPSNINPTASLVGLLHALHHEHAWRERATDYCWNRIEQGETAEVHDLMAILTFLENHPDRNRAEKAFERIAPRLLSEEVVALDPSAEGYVKKPLDWVPTPQSICRPLFSNDIFEQHLDALTTQQAEDGGWNIGWEPISPAIASAWRGIVTLKNLLLLRAWGRL
jgi:hypothetical protein